MDGANATAVYGVVAEAIADIRAGQGPFFIETNTVRWPGSRPLWPELSTGVTDLSAAWDDTRISGEHAEWIRECDPILRMARDLIGDGALSVDEITKIDNDVADTMAAATSFSLASSWPEPESALEGVFA